MNPKLKFFLAVYLAMILVIFILPFYSIENYHIIRNTTSQLGAQNTPNAWIMNMTFVMLGILSIVSGWAILKGFYFHRTVLLIFGISLMLTAVFRHAPISADLLYNVKHDQLHSFFASLTGFSFTLFAISTAFINENKWHRVLAILVGILATVLSILMFNILEWAGLFQRFIFMISFGWMIYLFHRLSGKNRISLK